MYVKKLTLKYNDTQYKNKWRRKKKACHANTNQQKVVTEIPFKTDHL